METKQKGELFSILAGAAFVLVALWQVVSIIRHFSVIGLLYLAVDIFFAVVLFAKKRDVLLLAATGALTLLQLYALARAGHFRFVVLNVLELLPVLALLALAVLMTTNAAVQYRDKVKQIWFVPIILSGVFFLANLIIGHGNFFLSLFIAAGYALAAIWIACPDGIGNAMAMGSSTGTVIVEGQGGNTYYSGGSQNNGSTDNPEGYVDMAVCILLLLLTCGVYWYIWIYRTTKYLNSVSSGEQQEPVTQLLLCMFVPFYSIYWIYKNAQRVDAAAKARGVASDIKTLCLVLAIFIPIVAPMMMQDKINNIVKAQREPGAGAAKQNSNVVVEPFTAGASSAKTELGVAAELKTYKELLDSGAITQEEYDKKKKQLLDE